MRTHSTPAPALSDRRTRTRLRDLCDEVLASFRAATSRDVITEQERAEGKVFMADIAPLSRR